MGGKGRDHLDRIDHHGGCHCGAVRFTVSAPKTLRVTYCNCSICIKTGYLHLIVPRDRFKINKGSSALTSYTFNTHTARHLFCATCGIKAFYIPRSHPDGYSVNARCLDNAEPRDMQVSNTNGKDWESAYPDGRGTFS